MKIKYVIYILFFILGCHSVRKSIKYENKEKQCLDSLKSFLAQNWVFNEKENIYLPTDKFEFTFGQRCIDVQGTDSILIFNSCLRNIDIIQAENLFGKPNKKNSQSIMYYLEKECNSQNSIRCRNMNITFDKPNHTLRCIFIW